MPTQPAMPATSAMPAAEAAHTTTIKFTIKSLSDLADHFDRLARQHEAIGGGLADTKQNKRETQIWARVYREAANDVRATSFDGWDALVAERDALRKALEHAATALESASYYFGDATNAAFARTSAEIARAALSKAEG